ncbi:hypothetical protein BCR43DRAFT_555842 [Syncephalastrum racemosum]|uniref:Uncharacterized protein n=1 Tax=Syncephalastrum racemosum TaxID=13706 RepID=A0A1X2HMU9_SYNRA|nr:hypothetical protein BCR43DRAFT_555842 [Syncephalastrum racemosum]
MANLDIKIKLANTVATLLLIASQGFSFSSWFIDHQYGFQGRDFIIILVGILHLLLLGLTIFQWLPSAPKDFFEALNYWYLVIAALNSGVALLWFFHLDIFAFVGLLWQMATLFFVYHRLRDYPPRNGVDMAFLNAPFSIYTSYTFFMAVWQIFQFSDKTKHHPAVLTVIIFVIGFVALHLVDYSHRHDWVFALTTAWILLSAAIFLTGTPHVVSLVVVGILVSAVARTLIPNWLERINRRFGRWTSRWGERAERAPLLGH